MPTIPVVWYAVSNSVVLTSPYIYGAMKRLDFTAFEATFTGKFDITSTGTQNGIATYERKQPLTEAAFGLIANQPPSNLPFDPSAATFSPSDFPKYLDPQGESNKVMGTITFPNNVYGGVGSEVQAYREPYYIGDPSINPYHWYTGCSCSLGIAIRSLQRSGSVYNFTFETQGSIQNYDNIGEYTSTVTFSQGGNTQTAQGTVGNGEPITRLRLHQVTVDYAGQVAGTPITVTAVDNYGRISQVMTVALLPIPRVTYSQDVNDPYVIFADGSQSFSPSTSISTYFWTQPVESGLDAAGAEVAGSVLSSNTTSTPRARLKIAEVAGDSDEYISRDVNLTLNTNSLVAGRNIVLPKVLIDDNSVILMPDGARITAAESGTSVVIRRFTRGVASGATLATLTGLSRPKLTARNAVLALMARKSSNREFEMRESKDGGTTWL